jgi:hypothetical protein
MIKHIKTRVEEYKQKEVTRITNKEKEINKDNTLNDNHKNILKSSQEHGLSPPTLLQFLRNYFDTKTLVHNFGRCLFDFCVTTEQARNKLRTIVRKKLKLEVVEKDSNLFGLEVQRQLQKFIDDHKNRSGQDLENTSTETVIPISKGLFSTKKSKSEILGDIKTLDKTTISTIIKNIGIKNRDEYIKLIEFFEKSSDVYKKYNIIDNSSYSKIKSLTNEWKLKYNDILNSSLKKEQIQIQINNLGNEYSLKIKEIISPFQKKFLDSIINKNTRHKNKENSDTINGKAKNTVNITNTPTPLKKSKYIVIKNIRTTPQNYIKYQTNIPIVQSP